MANNGKTQGSSNKPSSDSPKKTAQNEAAWGNTPTSGPVKTNAGWTVKVDRDLCITLAVCIGLAPEIFELDAEGKAIIKNNANDADKLTLLNSAKGCPVNAIIINDENGKRLWPDPE